LLEKVIANMQQGVSAPHTCICTARILPQAGFDFFGFQFLFVFAAGRLVIL